MSKLQDLRDLWGKSMTITSGFRCAAWNAKSGGSPNSMHLQGRAVDILCVSGKDKFALVSLALSMGFAGIGIGKDFVHVDNREQASLWSY